MGRLGRRRRSSRKQADNNYKESGKEVTTALHICNNTNEVKRGQRNYLVLALDRRMVMMQSKVISYV